MTPQPQHPQRCETCERFPCDAIKEASKTISSVVISEMLQSLLKDFTALVGCASHTSAGAQQQRIEQFDEILTDVAIMADESSIVGRDSIKKTERIYHEGSLFAYERMIGYLQKKKEKAIALLQAGDQHE